ncbi:hypothetical protein [Methanopyrus kandleri]|uniref:Uncharacterized protein n=1 Tax=Methanopyrus kandleri TaxID=2320 RepID=A0A832WMA3_9EURY|nr:hypothetical protein [Methanopyrus kandleri]HII70057.1 hypothetical protein [Methanopyrus kandleri]
MHHLVPAVLIMFFAVTAPVASLEPPSDPYEQWREELRTMFSDYFPHFDTSTPGDVKLTGAKVCCACEVTTRQHVEVQPGVEAEGVLVATSTKSGADIWFVNWNGWARKLKSVQGETPTDAAYAPSNDGGIVLFVSPSSDGVLLHAFRLSFVTYLNLPGSEALYVPELEADNKYAIRAPGKVGRIRVLHVGYEYSGNVERPLFLVLYTVSVQGKPVEEYGADLYSALVRVDPSNLSLEVVPGSVISDFQYVTTFDADVVKVPGYCEYRLKDRRILANWVAVAYAKQWKECGVYLTLLGYSPVDDTYLPIAHTRLSDEACSLPIGDLLLAHTTLSDGTVVFLTAWTDGRDPISYLKDLLNPSPTDEVIFDGDVIWCQPAVLEICANPRILASIRNKPAAIVPKGSKPVSLIGIKGLEDSAMFWLDVVESDGIRSFPIPVAVEREGDTVYATPCVLAVAVRTTEEKESEGKSGEELLWVLGTSDTRARDPKFVPNVVLPTDEFNDIRLWEPWASTLTITAEGVKSVVVIPTGKTMTPPGVPTGEGYVIGKMVVMIYQTEQGTEQRVFALPSVPIACLRSLTLIGGYLPVIPLRYRMLKIAVNISGPTITSSEEVHYRVQLSNLPTIREGLSVVIVVSRRNQVVGAALVKLSEPDHPVVEGDLEGVEVKSGDISPVIDVWVKTGGSGFYTVEVFFADALGWLMGEEAVTTTTVRRVRTPSQAPSSGPTEYIPPGLGVATPSRESESHPGVALPVPVPVRVRIRRTERRMTGLKSPITRASRARSRS